MNSSMTRGGAIRARAPEFEKLLRSVLEPAYRAAFHLVRSRTDAEEIVQEAALRAWRSFDTYEPGTSFRAWFHHIATMVFYARCGSEEAREEAEKASVSADLEPSTAESRRRLEGAVSATAIFSRIELEEVQGVLHSLPLWERIVAVLYFVGELSYQELAVAVDRPVDVIRSMLHRARRTVFRRLANLTGDLGARGAP